MENVTVLMDHSTMCRSHFGTVLLPASPWASFPSSLATVGSVESLLARAWLQNLHTSVTMVLVHVSATYNTGMAAEGTAHSSMGYIVHRHSTAALITPYTYFIVLAKENVNLYSNVKQ